MESTGEMACILGGRGHFPGPDQNIRGNGPNWSSANLKDQGRRHVGNPIQEELGSGIGTFYGRGPVGPPKPNAKQFDRPDAAMGIAEPAAHTGHDNYFRRRDTSGLELETPVEPVYRRHQKAVPAPVRVDKPQGRKYIPIPGEADREKDRAEGVKAFPEWYDPPANFAREPPMPLYRHPEGRSCVTQDGNEITFEREMQRKVRVHEGMYANDGRAGDLSTTYGAPRRVEDHPSLRRNRIESPTFTRFLGTLSRPATNPHERRHAATLRRAATEKAADCTLVAGLDDWSDKLEAAAAPPPPEPEPEPVKGKKGSARGKKK